MNYNSTNMNAGPYVDAPMQDSNGWQRVQELERDNARLIGQIQGMWETMKFFKLDKQMPGAIPPQ